MYRVFKRTIDYRDYMSSVVQDALPTLAGKQWAMNDVEMDIFRERSFE